MGFRILLYFGLLAFGWIISSKGFIHDNIMGKISKIQSLILFVLIFIMGIRVGMDEQVVSSIGQIGLKAFVFAFVTASLSVFFVHIARKKIIKDKNIAGGIND